MNSTPVPDQAFEQAVSILHRGGLVAFPTESWYGLAVDPLNEPALARLYAAKRRPADKPILVLVDGLEQLGCLVESVPEPYPLLMQKFWPGPLSLVFPADAGLPERLTGGSETVAVRCSSNPVAVELITRFGRPITGTSANISGTRPYETAAGVAGSLGKKIDMILDGGRTPGRKGSTIVAVSKNTLVCIREGQLPFSMVQAAVQ